ncbi:hypothetical protein G9A89_005580 [Geosiphon pyriformis]|nr:hypothetical protein G9A89_005580 [Geosiphon pyriformis]
MHACHYCGKQEHLQFECCKWLNEQRSGHQTVLTKLLTYNTTVNLSTTNLLANNTHYLSTTVPTHLSAAALGNLSAPTNSSTAAKLTSKRNPETKTDTTKLKINLGTENSQNLNSQHYLSLLVFPEDTQSNNLETNQQPTLTSNILPATITKNELLDAIFLFELEKPLITSLFSRAALEEKLITAIYTDVKVDSHFIKLILNSRSTGSIIIRQLIDQLGCRVDHAASAKIIIIDGTTKTLIDEIDNFSIKHSLVMTGYPKPMHCLIEICKSFKLAKMANTHIPPTRQHYSLSLRKKKRNLSGKLIKYHKLKKTTMNYHQYSPEMITEKRKKRKNLPETLTKTEKLTMIQMNYQSGNKKKPTKEKEKGKKKI